MRLRTIKTALFRDDLKRVQNTRFYCVRTFAETPINTGKTTLNTGKIKRRYLWTRETAFKRVPVQIHGNTGKTRENAKKAGITGNFAYLCKRVFSLYTFVHGNAAPFYAVSVLVLFLNGETFRRGART